MAVAVPVLGRLRHRRGRERGDTGCRPRLPTVTQPAHLPVAYTLGTACKPGTRQPLDAVSGWHTWTAGAGADWGSSVPTRVRLLGPRPGGLWCRHVTLSTCARCQIRSSS